MHIVFVDDDIHSLSKQAILSVDGIISEVLKKELIDEYLSVEKTKNQNIIKNIVKFINIIKKMSIISLLKKME